MAKNNDELPVVNVGHVYKANKDGAEVAPFFVDRQRSEVRFAQLGRSREMSLSIDDFLDQYTYVGLQSENAEKPASRTAAMVDRAKAAVAKK